VALVERSTRKKGEKKKKKKIQIVWGKKRTGDSGKGVKRWREPQKTDPKLGVEQLSRGNIFRQSLCGWKSGDHGPPLCGFERVAPGEGVPDVGQNRGVGDKGDGNISLVEKPLQGGQ